LKLAGTSKYYVQADQFPALTDWLMSKLSLLYENRHSFKENAQQILYF